MTEATLHPIPDDDTTLNQYLTRCINGPALLAQAALINQMYTQLGLQLCDDETLRGLEWLRTEIQFRITQQLLGAESNSWAEVVATLIAAYERKFSDWLEIYIAEFHWYTHSAVRQQLANAWHNIEELLQSHNPVDTPR